jgi:hypothetical protein
MYMDWHIRLLIFFGIFKVWERKSVAIPMKNLHDLRKN